MDGIELAEPSIEFAPATLELDPSDVEHWRTTLQNSLQTWRRELLSLHFEHRMKEKMAIIAATPHLKAGRYSKKIRDEKGQLIDINASVLNEARVRMAQLEVQMQEKEILIAQAEDTLAQLPPSQEASE